MLIGVDLDAVLADLMTPLNRFHNEQFGTRLTLNDYCDYNLHRTWQCTLGESIDRVYQFYESPFMETIPLMPGALEGIQYLKQKHDVMVITSRPDLTKTNTIKWCNSNFPNTFKDIVLSNQYSKQEKKKTKGEIGREIGIKAMIDDHIDYVVDCVQNGIKGYLFEAPWNRYKKVADGIVRLQNWSMIENYF